MYESNIILTTETSAKKFFLTKIGEIVSVMKWPTFKCI